VKFTRLILLLLLAAGYLLSPASFAATVDGEPSYNPKSDAGLYVWRTSNGNWKARLSAGGGSQKFTGAFEATQSIKWITRVSLESSDIATESQPGKLDTQFQVWNAGEDGINFGIANSTGICLRGSGSPVYLGRNAVPVNTPVDLTSSGACGGAAAPPPTSRKFNTGQYISLLRKQSSQSIMLNSVKPGVAGFVKRYTWRELEPSLGGYNFSEIESDLALVASQGMQLVVMIEDKTFVNEKPLPAYLSTDQYSRANKAGGHTAVRWSPYFVTRLKALIKALGQRFDAHPNFEGIAPATETAPSLSNTTLDATGYTPEKYRDALIDVLTDATLSLPTSRVFWFMNFLPRNQSYIGDIANAVKSSGVVMGGPDLRPDDHSLLKNAYPFYDQFNGQLPMYRHVSGSSYDHPHKDTSYPTKYWTMDELFRYARDKTHLDYMFWVRLTRPTPSDSYVWQDALPVIANNPVFQP